MAEASTLLDLFLPKRREGRMTRCKKRKEKREKKEKGKVTQCLI